MIIRAVPVQLLEVDLAARKSRFCTLYRPKLWTSCEPAAAWLIIQATADEAEVPCLYAGNCVEC